MRKGFFKTVSLFLACILLLEAIYPTAAWALTGGPSQPEVESFHAISTSEMVDLFSGDFSYNIPLLDVEGYPINISYHSGIAMDQEASWVGLGWNINPGVINRNMRGIPDDFDGSKGDLIKKEFNIKPNRTYGVTALVKPEFFGKESNLKLGFGLGVSYNTYKGFGFEPSVSASISVASSSKQDNTSSLGLGVNLKSSNVDGLSISPEISFSNLAKKTGKQDNVCLSAGFNSRSGLKSLTLGFSNQKKGKVNYLKPKNNIGKGSAANGGSSISLGMDTYIPEIQMPMINSSVMFSPKFGGSFFGVDAMYTMSGYYAEQKLEYNEQLQKAYGYFNTEKGNTDDDALLDFNREKDGVFTKNTPRLPVTNFTYDIYSVSGQGIGGIFKPTRGDIGYVFDAKLSNKDNSYSLGLDFAAGNLIKGGVDVGYTRVRSRCGKWTKDNVAAQRLKWQSKTPGSLFEPYYFKEAGEKSVDTDYLYSYVGEDEAVSIDLVQYSKLRTGTMPNFYPASNETQKSFFTNIDLTRAQRKKRNQNISFLTNEEAGVAGLHGNNYFNYSNFPGHHIGEVTAYREDGTRYIYGIPVYNTNQAEATFSVGNGVGDDLNQNLLEPDANGLITYNPTIDNTTGNRHGLDNYYNKTTIKNYAHSYLLTGVVSPDYIDNDGVKGPSKEDMGTYTLFNYSKIPNFKWRIPLGNNLNQANSNEGLKSVKEDDQANYLYGEKELYYLKSIETKNYIAVFETGPRADGFGAIGENGGINIATPVNLLKSITLYLKKDYNATANTGVNPLKKVFFEYDYSLCPNVENNKEFDGTRTNPYALFDVTKSDDNNYRNQGGKLTLKKIFFEYGDSKKARFSPYEFTYCGNNYKDQKINPYYQSKAVDRWGNFKPYVNNFRENSEFPYTSQDRIPSNSTYYDDANKNKTWTDVYASAWHLNNIKLPSGGEIQVKYESDDYGYVQDKQAMQMMKVIGMSLNGTDLKEKLYNSTGIASHEHYNNIHFSYDVPDGVDPNTVTLDDFTRGVDNLYFRFLVNVDAPDAGKFEYVQGYAKLLRDANGGTTGQIDKAAKTGWITVAQVPINDKNGESISSIAKAAWQFSRLYTPQYAYGSLTATSDITSVFRSIMGTSFVKNIAETMAGPNRVLQSKGHCQDIKVFKSAQPQDPCSYIRLLNAFQNKKGGGSRVQSLSVSDHASDMNISASSSYTQVYDYTSINSITKRKTSSGVAAYEPLVGGDENPIRQPIAYGNKQEKLLVPDDKFYLEEPMGESFYPAAGIGYSKITVKNQEVAGVKRHATGRIVHEFYTAKDFPIHTDLTGLKYKQGKTNPAIRLLKISNKDYMTAAQGYVIDLNDMHGKEKAQWIYAEKGTAAGSNGDDAPVSGVEYKYKSSGNRLINSETAISPSGSIGKYRIGMDMDMVTDMREQSTDTKSFGLHGNLESFLAAIFPGLVPLILPAFASEDLKFRSAVTTKVIQRYGLLEKTIVYDGTSKITTSNLAYDVETGEVLLTEVHNEFDDPIYNFKYPAHWMYDRMGPSYKNTGLTFNLNFSNGKATINNAKDFFTEGDEILFSSGGKFWITEVVDNNITVMSSEPATIVAPAGNNLFKLIRSGRRNQQTTSIGSVTCLSNPILNPVNEAYWPNINLTTSEKVINASSQEFSDQWNVFCKSSSLGKTVNPFYEGSRGNWRPKKAYTYLQNREYSDAQKSRKYGALSTFFPFWSYEASIWIAQNPDLRWKWVNETTSYDPYGSMEIENKDPLLRTAMAKLGYNHSLPESIVSNSLFSESFNDNFEDNEMNTLEFDLLSQFPAPYEKFTSHSGRRSKKVSGTDVTLDLSPICK